MTFHLESGSHPNKSGNYTIFLSINHQGERKRIKTSISIPIKFWDSTKERVTMLHFLDRCQDREQTYMLLSYEWGEEVPPLIWQLVSGLCITSATMDLSGLHDYERQSAPESTWLCIKLYCNPSRTIYPNVSNYIVELMLFALAIYGGESFVLYE